MNTILMAPRTPTATRGRVLAIEPDPARAQALRDLITDRVGAACEIVTRSQEAIRSIDAQVPDLVLTSIFLPPREEAELTAHLQTLPAAAHVQVITLPYLIDLEAERRSSSKVLNFLRPPALARPVAPAVVGEQIEAYLERARERSAGRSPRLSARVPFQQAADAAVVRRLEGPCPERATGSTRAEGAFAPRVPKLGQAHANDRRRERRRSAGELPWLWSMKLPSGSDVKVVDISSQGVLLETASKITPGTAIDLRVIGQDTNVCVPARMVRTEVASVDALGVRYRVAAAFVSSLDIRGLDAQRVGASVRPAALADLLARVLRELDEGAGPVAVRSSFEQGLRGLLPVKDVQILDTPFLPGGGAESVYFSIPGTAGQRSILQAIFERDYQPTAKEFRLLKAAAGLAAVILEFAHSEARLIRA